LLIPRFSNFRFWSVVVVRLKKWVKAVGNVFLFSTVFARGCEAIFKLSINCKIIDRDRFLKFL
jgi:hypothetical protein